MMKIDPIDAADGIGRLGVVLVNENEDDVKDSKIVIVDESGIRLSEVTMLISKILI